MAKNTKGRSVSTRDYSILSQLRALRGQRLATVVGSIVGAVVPVLVYRIAHYHAGDTPALWLIVAGGFCSLPALFMVGNEAVRGTMV
jgi:VIT1/CCC1 family predicted Fe2+/Mn2+ transporter